jgi:ferredoxin
MKIHLDEGACVGHGRCYALAPDVFEPDDMGHCLLRHDEVPDGLERQARTGADACPEDALTITD